MKLILLAIFIALNLIGFASEDKIARKISRSIPLLTEYLIKDKNTDLEKATAIYEWVTGNIQFNYDALKSTRHFVGVDPQEILRGKKGLSTGICELVQAMFKEAGIESETIDGYVHDVAWEPGDLSIITTHTWMALLIDGEWMLADPTWDSGYIGRIPFDKEYKHKKYIIPLKVYKKDEKLRKVTEKRDSTEAKRIRKFEEKPKFKEEVGFVQSAEKEMFLIHPDTFLLSHLPENPIWQLRKDYVSIEDFALSNDSLKLRLAAEPKKNLDFITGIKVYRSMDFLHKYIENGDKGFAFNVYNPGIKAVNYYNFLYLVNGRQLQKYARGSVYELEEARYPFLNAVNDTIIKYTKLYKAFEKDCYSNRRNFDKGKYATEKLTDKENAKAIRKIKSENEKLVEYIKKNNDKIKDNLDRLSDYKEKIEERYPKATHYKQPKELKEAYFKSWSDSMDVQISKIKALNKAQNDRRQKSSYSSLLTNLNYIDYLIDANAGFIQFKSYSNNEVIAEVDSLVGMYSKESVKLYSDSLRGELMLREPMDILKKGSTFLRLSRTEFKSLETSEKIDDAFVYETYMQAKYWELIEQVELANTRSAYFNDQVLPLLRNNAEVRSINTLIEDQERLKEKKNEYITEYEEAAHERNLDLLKQMKADTKKWKEKFKEKK